MPTRWIPPVALVLGLVSQLAASVASAQVDADAASGWARKNDCLKCHAVERTKMAPSFRSVAARYRGDVAAPAKLVEHLRSGRQVKLTDGSETSHKIVQEENAELLRNVVSWILSL